MKRFVNGVLVAELGNPSLPMFPLASGRRDVYRLEAGQGALIKMQFRDYHGRYLIHCHNMAHEDNFMMVRWDICDDQATLNDCLANQQVCELEMKEKERLVHANKEVA